MSEQRCRSQDRNTFSRSPNGFTVNKTTDWKCDNESQKAETSPNNGQGYISIQYTCNDRDCQGNAPVCNGYTIAMDQLNQNQSSQNIQILPSGPFVGPLNCCEAVTPRPTCQQWGGNFQKLKDKWSTVTKYNVANQNCMGQPTGCQLYEIETSKSPVPGELQIVLPGCPTSSSPKECCCCQLPPACACAQDTCTYSCAPCCPAQEDPDYCCLPKKSRQTVTIQVVLPKAKTETSETTGKASVAVTRTGAKNAKSHQNVKVRSTTRTSKDPKNMTRKEYNFSTRNAPDNLHAAASNESINNPYFASAPEKTKKTISTGRTRSTSKKRNKEIVNKGTKGQTLYASPPDGSDDVYYESSQSQREGSSLYPTSHSPREDSSLYPRSRRDESSSRRSQSQSEESSYPGSHSQRDEDSSFLTGQSERDASSYSRSHIQSEGSSYPRSERESYSRDQSQRDSTYYDKNFSNVSSSKYGYGSSRASKNKKNAESNKYFETISDDGSTEYVLKRSNNKYPSEPQYSNNNHNFYMDHNLQAGNPFMDQEDSVMPKGRKRIKSRDKSKKRGKSHLNELMNEPPTTKSLKQIETMNHQGQVQQSVYSVPNTQTLYNPFAYNNNNISGNNDTNGKKLQFLYDHKNASQNQSALNNYQVSQQYQGPHGADNESEVFGADTVNTSPKSFNQLQSANPFLQAEKHAINGDDEESIVWNPWFILLVGLSIIFVIFVIACFCLSPKKRAPRCMCNKPFPFC